MAFTKVTVTHRFTNVDGTPAVGTVQFTLTTRMTQPGLTITPSTINAVLDPTGGLSQPLEANTDPETTPVDAQWRVDLRFGTAAPETFTITVPADRGDTVDLADLFPQTIR